MPRPSPLARSRGSPPCPIHAWPLRPIRLRPLLTRSVASATACWLPYLCFSSPSASSSFGTGEPRRRAPSTTWPQIHRPRSRLRLRRPRPKPQLQPRRLLRNQLALRPGRPGERPPLPLPSTHPPPRRRMASWSPTAPSFLLCRWKWSLATGTTPSTQAQPQCAWTWTRRRRKPVPAHRSKLPPQSPPQSPRLRVMHVSLATPSWKSKIRYSPTIPCSRGR